MPLIVAIDGPSGVGKSTTSKLVARALGIPHIDTGAMYRAIALAAVRRHIDTRDEPALEKLANEIDIAFIPGETPRVVLQGEGFPALASPVRLDHKKYSKSCSLRSLRRNLKICAGASGRSST